MTNSFISLSDPILGEKEKKALCDTIDSGWLTMGDRVSTFEKAFAKLHDVEEAVAVNSCTAGLHLCCKALGIGPGDEVLVPSLTFVATVNAVLYVGAQPVFVDIESETNPHISLNHAKAKCNSRTKAVIVMHYGGYLVEIEAWRLFTDQNNILLIEDAAHAPAVAGVGRCSDAAAFSFFSNKNMCTAEGGMVLARDKHILKKLRHIRSHGMTTDTLTRRLGHSYTYDVIMLGYNYRMDEMRAAMGLVQLMGLPKWNQKRYELSCYYRQIISDKIPEVVVPFSFMHKTAAHLMPVLLPEGINRQKVMEYLRQEGIQSSIHYPPVHKFKYYQKRFNNVLLPKTEEFCAREITLPLHPLLTKKDITRIIKSLRSAIYGIKT